MAVRLTAQEEAYLNRLARETAGANGPRDLAYSHLCELRLNPDISHLPFEAERLEQSLNYCDEWRWASKN